MAAHKNSSMDSYLQTHKAVKGEGFTHTRIGGDKNSGIFAGSYKINDSEWKNFMEMYYQQVFVKGQPEHLTEKQLNDWGAKYHELRVDKPFYDLFIEDKSLRIEEL